MKNAPSMRFAAILLVSCLALAGIQGWAQPASNPLKTLPPNSPSAKVGWHSVASDKRAIYVQISDLYLSLYNSGQLPIQTLSDDNGDPVETFLRDHKLHFGSAFPVTIDALLCELNRPQLCDHERPFATAKNVLDMSSQIGGRTPKQGKWHIQKGSKLVVPNINFATNFELISVRKEARSNLLKMAKERGGCESFADNECQSFLDRVNYLTPNYKSSKYKGTVQLPVLSLSATIDPACHEPLICTGGFDLASANFFAKTLGPSLAIRGSNLKGVGDKAPAQQLLKNSKKPFQSIQSNTFRALNVRPFSIADQPLYVRQGGMFEFDNFPWINRTFPDGFQNPVAIGVVDGFVDSAHCNFATDDLLTIRRLSDFGLPKFRAGTNTHSLRGDCKSPVTITDGSPNDHGTHVLGILAAQLGHRGMAGMNPYAHVFALVVDLNHLVTPETQNSLAQSLKDLVRRDNVRVVNMSLGYSPVIDDPGQPLTKQGTDSLQSTIANLKNQTLYVVAGGPDSASPGADLSANCNVYPACLKESNVISVLALDGSRDNAIVPNWTNFGKTIDIGAFGGDIVSTGAGGTFVKLKGSSMAAPQVAAVASLLYAKLTNVAPIEIKNRLIACAVPTRALEGKVLSGRLDAECVLDDPEEDRLVLKPTVAGGRPIILHGKLTRIIMRSRISSEFGFVNEKTVLIAVPLDRLYALHREPSDTHEFIVWQHPNSPDSRTRIVRSDNLFMQGNECQVKVSFREARKASIDYDLCRVTDYVRQIFDSDTTDQ